MEPLVEHTRKGFRAWSRDHLELHCFLFSDIPEGKFVSGFQQEKIVTLPFVRYLEAQEYLLQLTFDTTRKNKYTRDAMDRVVTNIK